MIDYWNIVKRMMGASLVIGGLSCSIIVGNPDPKIGGSDSGENKSNNEDYVLDSETIDSPAGASGLLMHCTRPTRATELKVNSHFGCELRTADDIEVADGSLHTYVFEKNTGKDINVSRLSPSQSWPMIFKVTGSAPAKVNDFVADLDFTIDSFASENTSGITAPVLAGTYFPEDTKVSLFGEVANDFSVSVWFRIGEDSAFGDEKMRVCIRLNPNLAGCNLAVTSKLAGTEAAVASGWHHLAVTVETAVGNDGSDVSVMIDGLVTEQLKSEILVGPSSRPLSVILMNIQGYHLSQFELYNSTLSDAQIQKAFKTGTIDLTPISKSDLK